MEHMPSSPGMEAATVAMCKLANMSAEIDSYVSDVVRLQVPLMTDEAFENKDDVANFIHSKLREEMSSSQIHKDLAPEVTPEPSAQTSKQERLWDASIEAAESEKSMANNLRRRHGSKAKAAAYAAQLQGEGIAGKGTVVDGLSDSIMHGTDDKLSKDHLRHITLEWAITKYRVLEWALLIVYCVVFHGFVFRNMAFLQHRQLAEYMPPQWCGGTADDVSACVRKSHMLANGGVLHDIMFDLIADQSDSPTTHVKAEMFMTAIFTLVLGSALVLMRSQVSSTYWANAVTRALRNYIVISTIRPLMFLSTSLPGPAPKCKGLLETQLRPTQFGQVWSVGQPETICGDLVFSGHMMTTTLLIHLFLTHIGMGMSRRPRYAMLALLVAMSVGQCYYIIAARNHYTLDVLVGIIIPALICEVHHCRLPDPPASSFVPGAGSHGINDLSDKELLNRVGHRAPFAMSVLAAIVYVPLFAALAINTYAGTASISNNP